MLRARSIPFNHHAKLALVLHAAEGGTRRVGLEWEEVVRLFTALLLTLFAHGIAVAQSKIQVYLDSTVSNDDSLGAQFVYELKEAIRGSLGFRLVEDKDAYPFIRYIVVTTSSTNKLFISSAHVFLYDNVGIQLDGVHIATATQYCGRDILSSCVRSRMG